MDTRRHIRNILKCESPGDFLVWEHPVSDFFDRSILIVEEGTSAVFFQDGQIEQIFDPGRYELTTRNFPFLTPLRSAFTGGVSSFHCGVLFVSHRPGPELRFGTASPIQVRDRRHNILVNAALHGVLRLRAEDCRRLIPALTGGHGCGWHAFFRQISGTMNGRIRSVFATLMSDCEGELIGLNARLGEFSEEARTLLDEMLRTEYGLAVISLEVEGFSLDEEKYNRLDEAVIDRAQKETGAAADRAVMDMLRGKWAQQQYFDCMRILFENPNARPFLLQGVQGLPSRSEEAVQDEGELLRRIRSLRAMHDEGLLTEREYERQKQRILTEL